MNTKPALLITGIQGLIGWNLYQALQDDYEVHGFSKTRRPPVTGEWYDGLIEDYRYLSGLIRQIRPKVVIHTQAMCNLDLCEAKPQKTHLVNVEATERLLDALKSNPHDFVYVSSEHVFSGQKGAYTEEDKPDPISVYGRTRRLAEEVIQKRCPKALIIRPGLAIGKSLQGNIGPHDWLKTRLIKGLQASFFVDEYRSPVRMPDLVQGIRFLMDKRCAGLFHLGGRERMSRYELALRLTQEWGLEGDIIPKERVSDTLPRIADCSLNSSKAGKIGWTVPRFLETARYETADRIHP